MPGPPATSPGNDNDWIVGSTRRPGELRRRGGGVVRAAGRTIIAFEEGLFGPYPFETTGGVLDEGPFQFALEVQTRPVYATAFFSDSERAQRLRRRPRARAPVGRGQPRGERWSEIWLNEGSPPTRSGCGVNTRDGTAQEIFDANYEGIPRRTRSGAS